MLLLSKILLPLFFIVSTAYSQTLENISITGNKQFTVTEIRGWTGVNAGMPLYPGILDTALNRISENLSNRGYFNHSFTGSSLIMAPDSGSAVLLVSLIEGEPSYIRNINITAADTVVPENIADLFSFLSGTVFNKYELESAVSETLSRFEETGYPFGVVTLQSVVTAYDSSEEEYYADIFLRLNRNLKSTIDKIQITGNSSTKDYVITRELRLAPGETYSQKIIDEIPAKLNRLRFFEPVPKPDFYLNSENRGILSISITEKQTNNFDGIIGYIPGAAEGEKGYVTGLVNISLRNLFGTGRGAALRWQQLTRYTQELELKYLEPWVLSFPFNISGALFQRKQDTSYVQRRFEGTLEYLASHEISASVFISSESVIPALSDYSVFTVYNSQALTTGVSLRIDSRDDPYAPVTGIYFLNSYSFSRKKIYGPQEYITPATALDINLQRISLDIAGFYQLFSRQVAALSLHGRELRGGFFEESDLFRLGGTNTLRGYRENQFLAPRIFWSNLEYRLLLTRRSYAFLFFDTGYYLRQADEQRGIMKQEDFKTGYGLGLNIETGLGILGVSFALASGDPFSEGKIHFGLINEF